MPELNTNYKIAQGFSYQGDDWWKWWLWIDAADDMLDEIEHVVYTLHPTFANPVRKTSDRRSHFKLETEGWGTFVIRAKVVLKDGSEILLKHELSLQYPDGTANNE